MGGKTISGLQKLGKALMGAVAVLPVAAILMGIGYWIDPTGWGANSIVAAVLIKAGAAVLDNLGWVFAVAIAFGLARDHNGAAALSGFIGFVTITNVIGEKTVAGFRGVDLEKLDDAAKLAWASEGWSKIGPGNVLIGILVGLLAAWVYNRFHRTKLPDYLAFFSGRRLVPILTSLFSIVLAGILYFVWPFVFSGLFHFGQWIQTLGAMGAGIYGFANRLLIPAGLHHALNSIFWFDVIGINDINNFLGGAKTIAAAADATNAATCVGAGYWNGTSCEVIGYIGRYQGGFFPIMMFGLPGAALAMYLRADSKAKKTTGALMMAGALASFFTGVTEPIEFSFMFLAPALYLVHAVLTGISVAIAAAMHWTAGFGFSAGFVDMFLSARNPLANQWYMLLVMGVVFFAIYFAVFYFLIGAFDLRTPGRHEDEDGAEKATLTSDSDFADAAAKIIAGLGGAENINEIDYCTTRLRTTVRDHTKVNEKLIKSTGVAGMIRPSQTAVQVVVGPQVEFMYDEVAGQLASSNVTLKGEQEV
ncbi:PTS system N-acetylglucosamine-specific IIC component [Arcanobacterium wilhelmae]|uniref:PTS system N-acetylglucosamine-specific IIC component n=1 Tax=Arcanobacterium wilhelmae TaxID=1803177 RepID=A0ABT9ND50_9ACTO|nr:N-acetylglucosamine-specific PTS transporter subunit IIBC [Arcanobacterium wilhelmae]MDP9801654.1 PTS system N-acetylglucosamine-specific IIC component [Arcanobacterium wilhelmae]WFN90975.1 N-acetylglucosamine-specific PTS transporter subunit IIBC [Arcanobacterium wilhelmae]